MMDGSALDPDRFRSLHRMGFSVIPLTPRGKNPVLEWKGYQERRATDEEIEAWSRDPRGLNVGVVTGPVSGNLAVVDIDNGEARADLEKRFGPLPVTPIVKTGRGWHVYYVDPDGALRNFAGKVPGVDLRAIGGQVVGPGSVHSSGAVYRWEPGRSPHDIPIAPIPDWLKELARKTAVVPEALPAAMPAAHPSRPYAYAEKALGYEANRLRAAQLGYRNNTLNASAFAMGGLIGAGALDRDVVERTLFEACEANRLLEDDGERSVRTTLRSGIEAGMAQPRDLSSVATAPSTVRTGTNGNGVEQSTPDAGLLVLTATELVAMAVTPREFVIEPVIRAKDLVELFAARGGGKTWVALSLAMAMASGGALWRWKIPKPRTVLYVDGELSHEDLRDRVVQLAKGCRFDAGERLRILAADLQERGLPSLATAEGQLAIEEHLAGVEVLILDNLSCLFRGLPENEAESWEQAQEWLLSLRRRGMMVMFVHHAGKGGQQRGTSKREDVLDLVLKLERPQGYEADEGARFVILFDKVRGLTGQAIEKFEVQLVATPDGGLGWCTNGIRDEKLDTMLDLYQQDESYGAIAKAVGLNKSTVQRRVEKAIQKGLVKRRSE